MQTGSPTVVRLVVPEPVEGLTNRGSTALTNRMGGGRLLKKTVILGLDPGIYKKPFCCVIINYSGLGNETFLAKKPIFALTTWLNRFLQKLRLQENMLLFLQRF